MWVRSLTIGLGMCLVVGACTQATATDSARNDGAASQTAAPPTTDDVSASPSTTEAYETTTTASTTTTTTTEPGLDVYDPLCVVEVAPGDSIGAVVTERADELVTVASVQAENGISGDLIVPGQLLDVCVDNGLDDITGEQRLERNAAIVAAENFATVGTQQRQLNALLTPYGYPEMPVDGASGSVTQRALCATRLAMGFPVSRSDMAAGSDEEQFMLAMFLLPIPPNTATDGRWVLIDLTCQVMFVGEGQNLVFVFPTSTGEAEHETRLQERSRAFRFDPALDNGGWHNSSSYPVAEDNPLNGNMYKPIYFDNGQAIHGANSVPTSPQSKGCARLRPQHQDALVAWLGLAGVGGPVGSGSINATVTVRGEYVFG